MKDKIFLLSIEEVRELPLKYLEIGDYWWLRSPGYGSSEVANVNCNGAVNDYGDNVYSGFGVRPALLLDGTEDIQSWAGNIVKYLNIEWIDISKYLDKPILLAKDIIFTSRFDNKSNDYQKSEIRQKLLEWLREQEEKKWTPEEILAILTAEGQPYPQFKWGENITYTPLEVYRILKRR